MKNTKSFCTVYFEIQVQYEKQYGEKTVVFIQKGSFYEVYECVVSKIGKAQEIAKILNITLTSLNKNIENTTENPLMTGVPFSTLISKYLKVLMDHKYTVVVMDQIDDSGTFSRKVSKVYSPGTYNDEFTCSNVICGIYVDDNMNIGICTIDTNVYTPILYDLNCSYKNDDLFRIVHSCNPTEVLIFHTSDEKTIYEIIKHLHLPDTVYTNNVHLNKVHISEEYVYSIISKVYGHEMLSVHHEITTLVNFSNIAFVSLLSYLNDHDDVMLNNMEIPKVCGNEQMILHNSCVYQLNILDGNKRNLFNLIDKTCTYMGKRKLKYEIVNPITNVDNLNKCYDEIENLLNNDTLDHYYNKLKNIGDIERLYRQLTSLSQANFQKLCTSIHYSLELIMLHDYKNDIVNQIKELQEFIQQYFTSELYDMKTEKFDDLHKIHIKVTKAYNWLQNSCMDLSKCCGKTEEQVVKIEGNTKSGFAFICTNARADAIKKMYESKLSNKFGNLSFKKDKTKCKISSLEIENKFHEWITQNETFQNMKTELCNTLYKTIYQKFSTTFRDTSKLVASIDVLYSKAKHAVMYNYCKPVVKKSNTAYVHCKQLKHAIIELLDNEIDYIPNDVYLNNEYNCGILLYGVNGSGKSCYSKSIGLAIVLAQIGMYVPAEYFEYSPYDRLFTRINCDDNMFKGQSSFVVEMSDLKSILDYACNKSLIIGDEVCKGTEEVSALSIVGATLHHLMNTCSSFVFATHLHKLLSTKIISDFDQISIKHISIEFDKSNNFLKYTRTLKDGPCDSIYGLEIANYILKNTQFYRESYKIRNTIIEKPKLLNTKKSKYNSGIFVDKCEICGSTKELDIHHIEHQEETLKGGKKTQKTKNDKNNLVSLCKECHNNHHNGTLDIKGWIQTSEGKKLDYTRK